MLTPRQHEKLSRRLQFIYCELSALTAQLPSDMVGKAYEAESNLDELRAALDADFINAGGSDCNTYYGGNHVD